MARGSLKRDLIEAFLCGPSLLKLCYVLISCQHEVAAIGLASAGVAVGVQSCDLFVIVLIWHSDLHLHANDVLLIFCHADFDSLHLMLLLELTAAAWLMPISLRETVR